MSGTSLDGIDAVQVEISGCHRDLRVTLQAGLTHPYPEALRHQLVELTAGASISVAHLAELDDAIADSFAQAALAVQAQARRAGFPTAQLIGSHGQTLFHRPPQGDSLGYSWQAGRGVRIAHRTGLPTVSNFRVADIAAQGQGAPLVPAVDRYWLGHPTEYRCIQNIGGIGNVTAIPPLNSDDEVCGWDTGPGNSLLDLAVTYLTQGQQHYDRGGQWAAQGTPHPVLLTHWLQHPFFKQPPPKSTGRELFGQEYVSQAWQEAQGYHLSAADFLATLTELTATSIAQSYRAFLPRLPQRILVSGGGLHNTYLMKRLSHYCDPCPVESTGHYGIDPDYKEAMAFAVLAHWHDLGFPGNLPSVTGARRSVVLGEGSDPKIPDKSPP
jgi:anhydro-N-acetylmuramic acid kinase